MGDEGNNVIASRREISKSVQKWQRDSKAEGKRILQKIKHILRDDEPSRSADNKQFLKEHANLVEDVLRRKRLRKQLQDRQRELEDEDTILEEKCQRLSEALREAKHAVVYTGAGISTAAAIPDYRGPNGVWTKLSQGVASTYQDLSVAQPTLTHMILMEMHTTNIVKHIVSQNCDGLHVRSGVPVDCLSEVHGNMYSEVCLSCAPQRLYWRLFDVTEATRLRRHATARKCHGCHQPLADTIVHFGEHRRLQMPQNWQKAIDHAKETDLIICIGSSLKVLKSYHALWCMDRKGGKRPKLFIINLQWTPKDKLATSKINGKCDTVMSLVAKHLNISIKQYSREIDPLLKMCTPLRCDELNTFSTSPIVTTTAATGPSHNDDLKQEQTTDRECSCCDSKCIDAEKQPCASSSMQLVNTERPPPAAPGWFGKGYRKQRRTSAKSKRKL